jgi:aminopeptidase YwaD
MSLSEDPTHPSQRALAHLQRLCLQIPTRRVGSAGNRSATDFFAQTLDSFGFHTESPTFDCMDWIGHGARLTAGDSSFEAFPSPYSLGCHVRAPLVLASGLSELETADLMERIVLLHGDLAKEQLLPKKFPFYQAEDHRRIIARLESARPRAVIAATSRDPAMAGAVSPFPLVEDGEFDIPSVYLTEANGARLAAQAGSVVELESRAVRRPSYGCNVVGFKAGKTPRRLAFLAHIDSKMGSPGANDNASGVVVLLLLGELLATYSGSLGVEIVAINGEDYYSNPGEQLYLAANAGRFDDIVLGVNLDGLGYGKGRVAYSLYACPPAVSRAVEEAFTGREVLVEGEPWFQGDHAMFMMNQTPALAMTSESLEQLARDILHTPNDTPDTVDPSHLVAAALALKDLVAILNEDAP